MSDPDGTCEYVLDPDDPETWGGEEGDECYVDEEILNEDGVWTCPHNAEEEGTDLCVFHLPVGEKDDRDVLEVFMNIIGKVSNDSNLNGNRLQFIGAHFGHFHLDEIEELSTEDSVIAFSHAEFENTIDWSESEIHSSELNFAGVEFHGISKFEQVDFRTDVDFRGAIFEKEAKFRDGVIFRYDVNFTDSEFKAKADFFDAVFERDAYFLGSEFQKSKFLGVRFKQYADFLGSEFGSDTQFDRVAFQAGGALTGCDLQTASFRDTDLTGVEFRGSDLRRAVLESALLSRTKLFNADLRGAKLSGAVLGDVRIDENTKFLGHPEDDTDDESSIWDTLSELVWRSRDYCVYDPRYEDDNNGDIDNAKSVYRAIEELAGRAARPQLQSGCFVNRQDLQRRQYWDNTEDADNPLEWLITVGKASRARVARATLLYGESPWRVIAWSLGIILSFALLYPLGGWMKPTDGDPITYAQIASNPVEILNSVYYSTLTYTALGFGDFQPVGLGRLLTTVETGLGAVMLALLVFILGRRAAR